MNNGGDSDWLKAIAAGLFGALALMWQWTDRKLDKLRDLIDRIDS